MKPSSILPPLPIILPLLLTTLYLSAQAPGDNGHDMSTPSYGLAKIRAAIKNIPQQEYRPTATMGLSPSQYAALTLDEKFTYNMIYPESYSQMCSMMPLLRYLDASRIPGQIPRFFGEYSWSDHQRDFFKNNRDSVIRLIKETIIREGTAGLNLLQVIIDLDAKELTPLLINTYRRYHSNHYVLTTLMLLMAHNNYPEFLRSPQYVKLYGPTPQVDYLPYTTINIDSILQHANHFCHDTVRQ